MKYMVREPESGEEMLFPTRLEAVKFVENAIRFDIESGWNLIGVRRDICRTKRYEVVLTEEAKQALIDSRKRF